MMVVIQRLFMKAGETIVIKDPIETCRQMDSYLLAQLTMAYEKGVDYVCADRVFKPLQKYTEQLRK